ncbi:hypothetical protein AB5J62_03625 [Amycolatopsis sp. cg5]|uniref:hypothetical protein n=1 Tax=Amycolatopsis sp. cg5 TaxID=3238802 RepID=UPI0035265121
MSTKLRIFFVSCVLAVSAFGVSPALADGTPVAASVHVTAPAQVGPGPVLDPATTSEADNQKTKNKLIAGGAAVVLLLVVIWGRRTRSKKST